MQKIKFINSKGESIDIGYQFPFFLNKIEGLGDVESDITSQKSPYQDGSTFISSVLKERPISIEVAVLKRNPEYKQILSRVFNPKLGEGTLVYENDNGKWEVKAISEHVPVFPDDRPRIHQIALIDLFCPNPYWLTEENVDQLVVWEGGLTFPLQLPTTFASLSASKSKLLVNDGDVETPILITFNGPATAPITVKNVTAGKYIQINRSLAVGEKIEINTAFGQKKVTKVLADGTRENATHYIKIPGSEFFNLEVGNNLIEYSTGSDYEQAGVSIQWRNRFLAV